MPPAVGAAYLELEVHLHQPVNEDGAHLLVDVRLCRTSRQQLAGASPSAQHASTNAQQTWDGLRHQLLEGYKGNAMQLLSEHACRCSPLLVTYL